MYGADVVGEADHDTVLSNFPGLIREIRYPDTDTNPGQPSESDRLAFKYGISGQVAQRLDQRGVVLDFRYGTSPSSMPSSDLTDVAVTYPTPETNLEIDETVGALKFGYDARGQLVTAGAYASDSSLVSLVSYDYDSYGNLTAETLRPVQHTSSAKTTGYSWSTHGLNENRLKRITYPEGRAFEFDYGTTGGSTDLIDRAIGIRQVSSTGTVLGSLLEYWKTGSGRTAGQVWSGNRLTIDLRDGGFDPFGRIARKSFVRIGQSEPEVEYAYGYDPAGNRTSARIKQVAHDNDRSYLYAYDELGRLINAERGMLNATNDQITNSVADIHWNLDLLGNWTGYEETPGNWVAGRVETGDTPSLHRHAVNAINEIVAREHDADGEGLEDPESDDFFYDAAGNLAYDGKFHYKYDAWNRIVEVHEPGTLSVSSGQLLGNLGPFVAGYGYDAVGRRIVKRLDENGIDPPDEFFYYDGNRLIERYTNLLEGQAAGPKEQPDALRDTSPQEAAQATPPVTPNLRVETEESTATSQESIDRQSSPAYIGESDLRLAYYEEGEDPPDPTPPLTLNLIEQYVYGLNYVDEPVLQYDAQGVRKLVLQDANYNVIGLANSGGALLEQYTYDPYGKILAAEDGSGNTIDLDTNTLASYSRHQGLTWDGEIGAYYNRARHYSPELGRFVQRDPNETAVLLFKALTFGAERTWLSHGISGWGQYRDGANLYHYQLSNPIIGTDPAGLSWGDYNLWDEIDDAIYGITTERIAALAAAAKQANMALNTALMVGQAMVSLMPGGEAILLAGKLATGQISDFGDLARYAAYAGASIVGGYAVFKVVSRLGGLFRKARSVYKIVRACFVTGTLVVLSDGTSVPIERIRQGDSVLCKHYPQADSDPEACAVLRTFERTVGDVLDLRVVDEHGQQHTITATPEHPFYNARVMQFVPAEECNVGDTLFALDGSAVSIRSKSRKSGTFTVHNLEVDNSHNYFVSCTIDGPRLLVHNNCVLRSLIGKVPGLERYASKLSGEVQRSIDTLTRELAKGNLNPGIGTKHLFDGIFESRARNGARVYWRSVARETTEGVDGAVDAAIEILGKSDKSNQSAVIRLLESTYGN